MDTLKLAETEFLLWTKAHVSLTQKVLQNTNVEVTNLPIIHTLENFEGLMSARTTSVNLSLLHSEVEALIWEIECM